MREDRAQSRQGAEDMQINMLRFLWTLLSFITQNSAPLRLCARPCLTGELQKLLMRKCRAQSRQGAEEMQINYAAGSLGLLRSITQTSRLCVSARGLV